MIFFGDDKKGKIEGKKRRKILGEKRLLNGNAFNSTIVFVRLTRFTSVLHIVRYFLWTNHFLFCFPSG